ncbi:hypothetical protein PanWU01x14_289350, partial [Parasponia andersonii]
LLPSIKILVMKRYFGYRKTLTVLLKTSLRTRKMSSVNTSSLMAGTRTVLIFLMLVILFLPI